MLKRLLLIALLAPVAGCTVPLVPAAAPAPRTWSADAPVDSIAHWAVQSCRSVANLGKVDHRCVERALYALLETGGVARAMAALDRSVAIAPSLLSDAHGIAHGLGIAAYRSPETLAATFASCPATQISGCQHGVIQGFFLAMKGQGRPMDTAALDAVCQPHRGDPTAFFQCAHGLGHGTMAYEGGHLPRALERCDRLTDAFVRESCYGGALMENIVSVTHPHHTAEAHAASSGEGHEQHGGAAGAHPPAGGEHAHAPAGEHADHGAHGEPPAAEAAWVPLRRDDLLYPCTILAARYLPACYDMQTSAGIALTLGNVGAVARACASAPAEHVRRCYASLGRDVSALAALDHQRAVDLCGRAGPTAVDLCLAGVAAAMHNRSSDPADAIAFCRSVPSEEGKEACYRVVNGVVTLAPRERREALCAATEPEFTDACRSAAGLAARSED